MLYLQNVLKYAYEIDTELGEADVTELSEIVGEGLAFWRVLKPWLKARDPLAPRLSTVSSTSPTFPPPESPPFRVLVTGTTAARNPSWTRTWRRSPARVLPSARTRQSPRTAPCAPLLSPPVLLRPGAYTVGGVTYTFANDVGASLQFSEAIADIKSMLTNGDSMANVAAAYTNLGLRGLADLPRIADADGYTLFNAEHGSVTWISDLMDLALASPNTWVPKLSARNEIIEKTLMDALAVQCIHDDLAHAATAAHSAADKRLFFDHAAAKFLGTSTARGSTVFARGNKRGLNYGTTAPDGDQLRGKFGDSRPR